MRRHDRLLIEPGRVVRAYSKHEAADLTEQWLAVFGANGLAPGTSRFLWHVFSGGHYPALKLDEALRQYALEACAEYVVLSNSRDEAFVTDLLPTASSLIDWYVFPANFAWTMAFTHEAGWLGPYFARHPRHVLLDAENEVRLKKMHAAEQAKQRGWA